MRQWHVLALLGLIAGVAGASAQQTSGQDAGRPTLNRPTTSEGTTTLSVDARLVNVPVIVRDKKGEIVKNLTKDDFTLNVDTKQQIIRYFDLDTNLPLTLGLLVDTSMSQTKVLDQERTASSAFLDTMLTPQRDKAFVIQFAHTVELLQDLTDSRPKLQQALKELDTDPSGSGSATSGGRGSAGTTLYDSVFLAADELMSKQTGRKALILLTDGADRGSKETLTKAIEAAQRADVVIYAIYFKGSDNGGGQPNRSMGRGGGYPGGRGGGYPGGGYPGGGYPGGGGGRGGGQENRVDGKKVLQRMADETGGRMFEASKKDTVDDIYHQIGEDLRSQYRLGFTPNGDVASDGYHQIDLVIKRADAKTLSLQTRDGYYTGK